ncbi:MAG: hypothetical protein ACTSWP_10040 [Candidatus Freyarchaeota archaeon]|nr:hypothetical protein [Candidatus Freyrarchaeum guaymaensis]
MEGCKKRDKENYREATLIIINICKHLASLLPFKLPTTNLKTREKEINIILRKLQVTSEELHTGSLIFSILVGILIFLPSTILLKNVGIAITFTVTTSIAAYNLPFTLLLKELERRKRAYGLYADTIIKMILFAERTTGNIYDAIIPLTRLDEEEVTFTFRKIARRILCGENMEKAMIRFAQRQPTRALKLYLPLVVRAKSVHMTWRQVVNKARMEIRDEYQRYTLELENRMMLATSITFLLPVFLTMWSLLFGATTFIYTILPIQLCGAILLSRFFLYSKNNLIE